jgi:hypothetical protein
MDIKEAAVEGQNKALAWLTANISAEEPAPATPQAVTQPIQPVVAQPAGEQKSVEQPVIPPAQPVQAKPGIADAIRRDREQRAAQTTAQVDSTKKDTELATLKKELADLKALGATSDPFEFLRLRKLSKDQQAEWGQALLYDLRPDVAPQNFRLDLYKAEQARKEEAQRAEQERAAQEEAVQAQQAHLTRYADELMQHVTTNSGSSPESELWFTEAAPDGTEQVNHLMYARSLMATADNLARTAAQRGQQADLSPANVAKVLEQEVARRMSRRDAKKGQSAPEKKPAAAGTKPPASGTQPTTTSAEGLRGGPPEPKDMSDTARKQRAIEAGWGAGK